VGSGAGIASIAVASRVGASGSVTGADISRPLVQYAMQRVADLGLGNVGFVVADVQQESIDGAPFDLAISQFGVLFFDDPVAAFSNIRRQLESDGRLAFACWQSLEQNRWHINHALAPYLPAPPLLRPGASRCGPFSLGDPDHARAILASAGWRSIERQQCELRVTVPRGALFDDDQLEFLGIPSESAADAASAVERHLSAFEIAGGRFAVELAVQLFTALV
jgi:SAM-dependent methyltransferase